VCVGKGGAVERFVTGNAPKGVTVIVDSPDKCLENVQSGVTDAFVYNSALVDYAVTQKAWCTLMTVGGLIVPHDFGLFINKNVSYSADFRDLVSQHILSIRIDGSLDTMISKWWNEGSECPPVDLVIEKETGMEAESLWGLCTVSGAIIAAGLLVMLVEVCVARARGRKGPGSPSDDAVTVAIKEVPLVPVSEAPIVTADMGISSGSYQPAPPRRRNKQAMSDLALKQDQMMQMMMALQASVERLEAKVGK